MSGIRISASQAVALYSPPYAVLDDGDGDYNVWIVANGTPTRVTPYAVDGNVDSDEIVYPVLSPDGLNIIFRRPRLSDGSECLCIVPASGGAVTELLAVGAGVGNRMMHPMWHPDSDQIVYSRGEAGAFGGDGIYVTDKVGAGPTLIYTPPAGYRVYRPQYNSNGSKIAFWLQKNSGTNALEGLYVMNADGSGATQVKSITAPYRFDGAQFAWANQALDMIAFDNNGDDKLYVINIDGTGETLIGVGEIDSNSQPVRISKYAWKTDDSEIFVASRWFDGSVLRWVPYSVDPAGGGVTRLNDTHGPYNQQYGTNLFYWARDSRLYFEEVYGSASGTGKFASMAIDGTGYRVEHLLSDTPDLSAFYAGTGFEYV